MGYYSEVAYAIVFKSTEDREAILNTLTAEERELVTESLKLDEPDRILFYANNTKWYATGDMAPFGLTGFSEIDTHEKLLENAENNAENVYSMGVFMRLGEDLDDFDQRTWGIENAPKGFPEWYDLVDIHRGLSVGWGQQ
jgi:hypothetical protein